MNLKFLLPDKKRFHTKEKKEEKMTSNFRHICRSIFSLKTLSIVYSSGSQPGVREEMTGGTPNYFNESKKAILMNTIRKKATLMNAIRKKAIFMNMKISFNGKKKN